MRRNLGAKGREVDADARDRILELYDAFDEADPDYSKVFTADDFAYWTITVERPLLDEDGDRCDRPEGQPKPDPKKRDTENIPFTYGGNAAGDAAGRRRSRRTSRLRSFRTSPTRGSTPRRPKVGYEIPFTRHFYKYVPPRPLAEIDADLEKQVAKILKLLREVER